jgi:disulfide bond formation protein DsbB
MTPAAAVKLNVLALYAIAAVLLAAFYFQFALGELPCPLCLL